MRRYSKWALGVSLFLIISGCSASNETTQQDSTQALESLKTEPEVFYVPNAGEGTISIVDPSQGKTLDSIALGSEQASHGIALSPDGQILYAGTGFSGKTLVSIDTKTKQVIKKLGFQEGVHGIDISPNGTRLYISLNPGLGKTGGGLAVVDSKKMEQIAYIETGEGPAHVAVSNDGSQVWVANVNGNSVAVIDAKQNQLLKVIPVGEVPNEVAVSPDGKLAFSANVKSNNVSVIDAKEFKVLKEISAGVAPHGVTVTLDGKELWVSNNKSNDVTVIDLEKWEVVTSIPTGSYANHVAFSPDGQWAYVTNRQSNDVVKIDRASKKVIATIPVGKEPHEISLEDYVVTSSTAPNQSQENPAANARTQSVQMDSIDIEGTWLRVEDLKNTPIPSISKEHFDQNQVFRITLNTHSGDLTALNLEEQVFLITEDGSKLKPSDWIAESEDSHHTQYIALFKGAKADPIKSLEINGLTKSVLLNWK